ncbi:reprolysin-like metallopeptidase [Chryseobacterium paridis]|uniref:Fibronectin type III domain-containing protein n=1 Tax=Chryseobacterium paridis TaxID=2800328 RepID=A0ABS1G0U1_9FLAO|nr:zinc-dependent metalloprotease family protein [Chryseobacterium paridis]MBK1898128.1 fibronectin type III domain-containing protein [Chryseobacterium paridis]
MKKLLTTLFCSLIGASAMAQWTPTTYERGGKLGSNYVRSYYKLDLDKIKSQLRTAQEMGPNSKPVEILLPTMGGKIERFAVYSFPVMTKDFADQYQLGSYAGVSLDDPSKYLRFSVAPNDFQSMIIQNGKYEFIDAVNADKTVYGVHPKTKKNENGFLCSTTEDPVSQSQINELLKEGKSFTNQPTTFSKTSDKKYRTMRLAMSVTGEYTQYFGGVANALAQINATVTRVNAVFEKDFALHLNVLSYPTLIFDNPASDPYATVTNPLAPPGSWNLSLQQQLTTVVGSANYDIGHLFGASGGGGNAGCIGCVCIAPANTNSLGKGSGITSPATGTVDASALHPPSGDTFDIDYVAHEMGHQLGANHTFAHSLEGAGVNMEPGSGTTIMGYAGITGPDTDVQPHSDPYFHIASIKQVQANLIAKTCDVETDIANNPPVIAALPTYNIPLGTAFVLTASATDAENDPLTYTWEEVDNANVTINKANLGTTSTGASFRSVAPTTSPTRYFPKFSSVMSGVLNNSNNQWESVSMVPRTTKFSVTVRDNNPAANQQQTQFAEQTVVVGNNGPFKINNFYVNNNVPSAIEWDVANTTAAPYSVANVKIDYTTDNGTTWTLLSASTPNDGTENYTFPSSLNGQTIKVRISAIGNIFYTVKSIMVTTLAPCSGAAPTNLIVSNITAHSADVTWQPVVGATYKLRYKKVSEASWTELSLNTAYTTLNNLVEGAAYEVQVATVCSGTTGTYSPSTNFTIQTLTYCVTEADDTDYEYISNVTVANINNTSLESAYTNYTTNPALQINVIKGSTYPISVTIANPDVDTVAAWIDYNKNGVFEANERVLNFPVAQITGPVTGSFTVPQSAVTGQPMRMRVVLLYGGPDNAGGSLTGPCGTLSYGEAEDYNVVATSTLGTSETVIKNDGIQLYPNPASDVLNITKVSDKATYKIYSVTGQLVGSGNINGGKINVSTLVKGGYVITVDEKGKDVFKSKFIKK